MLSVASGWRLLSRPDIENGPLVVASVLAGVGTSRLEITDAGAVTITALADGTVGASSRLLQADATGRISASLPVSYAPDRAVVSGNDGGLGVSVTTAQEVSYLSGATSNIQSQIDGVKATSVSAGAGLVGGGTLANAVVISMGAPATLTATTTNSASGTTHTHAITGLEPTIALTASRAVVSNSLGKLEVSAATSTEVGYLAGVTSSIQTQLNGLEPATTLTASRAVVSNSLGKLAVSAATSTEVGYLAGVTSSIQAQLNAAASAPSAYLPLAGGTMTGNVNFSPGNINGVNAVGIGTTNPLYMVHLASTGNASMLLQADTDDDASDIGSPFIIFSQDGGNTSGVIGLSQLANRLPDATTISGPSFTAINNLHIRHRNTGDICISCNAGQIALQGTSVCQIYVPTTNGGSRICAMQSDFTNQGIAEHIFYADGSATNRAGWRLYSDARMKTDIVDSRDYLEDLCRVRVRKYKFIGTEIDRVGVIAQELQDVFPHLVNEDFTPAPHGPSTYSVNTSDFTFIIISAVQSLNRYRTDAEVTLTRMKADLVEQQATIVEQQATINELRLQTNELRLQTNELRLQTAALAARVQILES